MAGRAKVGYLRGLVELCPHAVAHKVPHHGAAVGLHILLHRVGDVKDAVARAGHFNALPEALLGHLNQVGGLGTYLPAGKGSGTVAVKAVNARPHIHADNVALL